MESIFGVTRAAFIYHQSMYLSIREKLGTAASQQDQMWPEMSRADGDFHRYLESQGVDINAFVNASQEWNAHFEADPSGQAMVDYQAELHQLRARRDARPTAAEYEQISRDAQLARQNSAPNAGAIHGITKDGLAEILSKYTELKAKFGERQAEEEFSGYLGSRGLSPYQWAKAHNAWLERFRADPTGRAEAEFHMMLAAESQKAHFGDVRDMSQDTEEGITLDQYAQITVAVSRQGADADAIVRQFGLQGVDHWQRANAAWTAKMGADTTHKLTMQFGQLYQKHAGPQFQQELLAQTADILAQRNQPQDVVREPEVELTPDLCLQKMQSPSRNERWKYAGLYANMTDLGNVPDKAAAIRAVAPILLEMIEQHDEHTTSDAEKGIRQLWDLEVRTDDVRGAASRCLNRAREKLTSVQAAFAPIQNQAVPERVTLQSRIQDYTSLVETMEDYLGRDWTPAAAAAPAAHAPASTAGFAQGPAGFAPSSFAVQAPTGGGGFPRWILAPLVLVVVGGGFAATRLFGHSAASSASATTSTASSTSITAASAAAAAKPSAAAATATAATQPSPTHAAAKPKKK